MKKAFGFVLAAASLLLTSGAQAQGLHVRANVPFDFAVGNKLYTAGSYDIQGTAQGNESVILKAEGGRGEGISMSHACSSAKPAANTVLVFERMGGEYYLAQIWRAGSDTGTELPKPTREMRLARGGKTEEVVIAANLVK